MENSEIIIKQHDLKLKIQKAIMEDIEILKGTPDIGYTSWLTSERIVNEILTEKTIHRKKNFIDLILPKGV